MAAKNAKEDARFEDKQKALDAALSQIEKQFGKGAVMKLGDNNAQMQVEVVPSGSLSLDLALGVGGVPKGRIVEVYGPESSGKTTLSFPYFTRNAQIIERSAFGRTPCSLAFIVLSPLKHPQSSPMLFGAEHN